MLVAVAVDRLPFDILHREPGHALRGNAAIEEPRDIGVLERGDDLQLLEEPPEQIVRTDSTTRELERCALPELSVVALREVHRAHPTAPDLANDPVWANTLLVRWR